MQDTTFIRLRKFGKAVRRARQRAGLSQEDFAEVAGIHRNYVGQIERAEVNVSFENLVRLSRATGLKLSALFRRAGL